MMREFFAYIKKEKIYVLLFLLMAAGLGFGTYFSGGAQLEQEESKATLQTLKAAETHFQDEVKKAGSLEKYLKDKPKMRFEFQVLSMGFLFVLVSGLFVQLAYWMRSHWRAAWQVPYPPFVTPWQLDMLFKVIVQFMLGALAFTLILGLLKKFVFPDWSDNLLIILHTAFVDILSFYLIVRMIKSKGGNWKEIGFRLPGGSWMEEVKRAWTAYLGVMPLFFVLLLTLLGIAHLFNYEPPPHPLVNVFLEEQKRSPLLIGFSLFLAVILGPFFEEVFFRGFCYNIFKKRWGKGWALVLSSGFFAFIHDSTFAFWPIFLLGMALAWLYEKRGSLFPAVLLHVTHNCIFIGYFFLAKDVIDKAAGG